MTIDELERRAERGRVIADAATIGEAVRDCAARALRP
jgi:hypothetical protein